MNRNPLQLVGWAYCLLLVIFLFLPVMIMVPASFSPSEALSFPPTDLSLRWYQEVLSSGEWLSSAWLSAKIGFLAALVATIAGLSVGLAHFRYGKVKSSTRAFLLLPMVAPHIVLATGLFSMLLYIQQLGSGILLAFAHACLALPLTVIVFIAAFEGVDPLLWTAASSLGGRWPKIIREIVLPNVAGAVVISLLLAFISSWDEVTLSVFVGPTIIPTLPSRMFGYLQELISPSLTAIATLLMALTIFLGCLSLLVQRARRRRTEPARVESL
ncbi:ABC transporter permease [Rhodoligotrophos ferricapiens]|uniref:ABC transporter permease n=1 Tax=Rhodoligotrophos ferricapiens TaxID=3069264 RepID=UPI00315DC70B